MYFLIRLNPFPLLPSGITKILNFWFVVVTDDLMCLPLLLKEVFLSLVVISYIFCYALVRILIDSFEVQTSTLGFPTFVDHIN